MGVKTLARAFRWRRMLEEGRYGSISELAAAERVDRGYLGRLLQLTLLAPDIVEAVLDGLQGADADLARLTEPLPSEWSEQRAELASPRLPRRPGTPDAIARSN